jgi:hypothetical protein
VELHIRLYGALTTLPTLSLSFSTPPTPCYSPAFCYAR